MTDWLIDWNWLINRLTDWLISDIFSNILRVFFIFFYLIIECMQSKDYDTINNTNKFVLSLDTLFPVSVRIDLTDQISSKSEWCFLWKSHIEIITPWECVCCECEYAVIVVDVSMKMMIFDISMKVMSYNSCFRCWMFLNK